MSDSNFASLSRQEIIRRVILKTQATSQYGTQKQRRRLQKELEQKTTEELINLLIA